MLLGPAYAARASSTPGQGAAANVGVQQEPSMSSGAMPTAVAGTGQPLGGDAVTREAELEKAVDAAETAVAVMQARLLAALKEAADAAEEAGRVRREAERERDRLEAEVRGGPSVGFAFTCRCMPGGGVGSAHHIASNKQSATIASPFPVHAGARCPRGGLPAHPHT